MKINKEIEDKPLYSLSIGEFVHLLQAVGETKEEKREYGKYLGFRELQELTGYSKQTLYQLSSARKIPGAYKIGKKVLFETSVILEWISSFRVATSEETNLMIIERRK
jgi:predicted DNA-binding transcriptional regulator AlpA